MKKYVIPTAVLEEVVTARRTTTNRVTYTDVKIKEVTDSARLLGVAKAADKHGIPYQTVYSCVQLANERRMCNDKPILLIFDLATQHTFDGMTELCLANNIVIVKIPASQTHCWQPADQYIIPVLKEQMQKSWLAFVEGLFANKDIGPAVAQITTGNQTVLKTRIYHHMNHAIRYISTAAVVASWSKTGILRAVFSAPPNEPTNMDILEANGYVVDVTDVDADDLHVLDEQNDDDDAVSDCEVNPPPPLSLQRVDFVLVARRGRPPIERTSETVKQDLLDAKRKREQADEFRQRFGLREAYRVNRLTFIEHHIE